MPADRAVIDDELRARLIDRVMVRDGMTKPDATRVVNALSPQNLIRLEMETREHEQPAFTADYNPYERA